MKPIVVVPGFAGSKLVHTSRKTELINIGWKPTKQRIHTLDEDFCVDDFGGTNGIRNLSQDLWNIDKFIGRFTRAYPLQSMYGYTYFDPLFTRLEARYGYKSKETLFGAPYDFRKIMIFEFFVSYMQSLKELIQSSYDINGVPCVLLAHSIGATIVYIFLTEFVDNTWKQKHVGRFVSVSAPYGGCSMSLKAAANGTPLPIVGNMFSEMLMNSTGLCLAFPNRFGYSQNKCIVKHGSRETNVLDIHQYLNELMHDAHLDSFVYITMSLAKNTGVPTDIVYTSSHMSEDTYVVKSNTWHTTSRILGDSIVPLSSLLVHKDMFPDYRYIKLSGSYKHTDLLKHHNLVDILLK